MALSKHNTQYCPQSDNSQWRGHPISTTGGKLRKNCSGDFFVDCDLLENVLESIFTIFFNGEHYNLIEPDMCVTGRIVVIYKKVYVTLVVKLECN